MKKGNLFSMNGIDFKFSKRFIFPLSIVNLSILEMIFDSFDIYLRHALNIAPWDSLILESVLEL